MSGASGERPLEGRWALVTGASRGIGREIARALAAEGCSLVVHSRLLEHTAPLVRELEEGGTTVRALATDLADLPLVRRLADEVLALVPHLDILYNNAAIMTPWHQDWLLVSPEEFDLSFRVNTLAPMILANRILPAMIQRGWGRVVNITSGIQDQPELMAYAASKAALDKYTRDMAPKLGGTGVSMNLLDPGWLKTDLGGKQAPGEVESVVPGALVPLWAAPERSGVLYRAQDFAGHDTASLRTRTMAGGA